MQTATSVHVDPHAVEPRIGSSGSGSKKDKAKRYAHRAEAEAESAWDYTKSQIMRPGVAGGILGIVNVGLLATAGYSFYNDASLRRDKRAIGGTIAGALILIGAEGWLAEAYAKTEAGQREAEKAREEGDYLYRRAHQLILRPGVFGGFLGASESDQSFHRVCVSSLMVT